MYASDSSGSPQSRGIVRCLFSCRLSGSKVNRSWDFHGATRQDKFILLGGRGSWTGNTSRPWADNEHIIKQLFRYLKPSRGVTPPQLPTSKSWEYEVTVSGLQAAPVANSLSQISRPHYRLFFPRKITNMPYFETYAHLQLTCKEQTKDQAARLEAKITDFQWFYEQPQSHGD